MEIVINGLAVIGGIAVVLTIVWAAVAFFTWVIVPHIIRHTRGR